MTQAQKLPLIRQIVPYCKVRARSFVGAVRRHDGAGAYRAEKRPKTMAGCFCKSLLWGWVFQLLRPRGGDRLFFLRNIP